LEQAVTSSKRSDFAVFLPVLTKVMQALSYAHQYTGIDGKLRRTFHLHLHPKTILLSEDLRHVAIEGLGYAQIYRNLTSARFPRWQEPGVYPQSLPPEFFRSRQLPVKEKAADVYSMGVVMYFALTGEYPFEGPEFEDYKDQHLRRQAAPPRVLNPLIPASLDPIILRCLEKNPDQRWENVADIQTAFEAALRTGI